MAPRRVRPSYSIRDLSRLTGLSSDRIRAWEFRYGLLRPGRTPNGYRSYGPDDLCLLLAVRRRLEEGASVGEIAALGREAILSAKDAKAPAPGDRLAAFRHAAFRALGRGDMAGFCRAADDASRSGDAKEFWDGFAGPVLEEVGNRWALGSLPIWIEHYVTRQVRRRLEALWQPEEGGRGPTAILFCPEGELHELPLLGVAARLRASGYRPIVLGANLPVASAIEAAESQRAVLAAVSVTRLSTPTAARSLAAKLAVLSERCTVVVGGQSAERYRKEFEAARIAVGNFDSLSGITPSARAGRRRKGGTA
jgi:methylmalonyl-CoA mutase cobalamin-binding subunit